MQRAGNAEDQRRQSWKDTSSGRERGILERDGLPWRHNSEIKKEPAATVGRREKMVSLSMCVCAKSLRLCSTLGDSMDYGLSEASPSVRGTLQARILKWIVMPSSRESSLPRGQTCVSYVSCIVRQILYH